MNINVASTHRWMQPIIDEVFEAQNHAANHISTLDELEAAPEGPIFIIHWNNIIPPSLLDTKILIGFHMTDLPYGRGGSPLQNLILRGHKDTVLTAFRVVERLDAGPVYAKRPLDLSGTAQDIYARTARLAAEMAVELAQTLPNPIPQEGLSEPWPRRRPEESELPFDETMDLYDFIRMLDAEGYPHAFVDHGPWRIEFTAVSRDNDALTARACIRRRE